MIFHTLTPRYRPKQIPQAHSQTYQQGIHTNRRKFNNYWSSL